MGSVRCLLVAAAAFALVVTGCGAPSGPSTVGVPVPNATRIPEANGTPVGADSTAAPVEKATGTEASRPAESPSSVRKRVNCTSPDGWRVVGTKKFTSGTEVLGSSLVCITAKNNPYPGHTYRVSLLSSESVAMSVTVTERSGSSVISKKRFQWTGAEKSLGPYDTARAGVVYSFKAKTGSYQTDIFSLSANGFS